MSPIFSFQCRYVYAMSIESSTRTFALRTFLSRTSRVSPHWGQHMGTLYFAAAITCSPTLVVGVSGSSRWPHLLLLSFIRSRKKHPHHHHAGHRANDDPCRQQIQAPQQPVAALRRHPPACRCPQMRHVADVQGLDAAQGQIVRQDGRGGAQAM